MAKRRKPAKGWGKVAPKTRSARRRLLARCGRKAFLQPGAKPEPKYPVVSKYTRDCKPDCRGLLAAKRRADQYDHPSLARKAQRMAKQAGCRWTR